MSLTFDAVDDDGKTTCKPVFPNITRSTRFHHFRSVDGLLHETQFTQPALALMEIARFEDMRRRGVVEESSQFAGHSLGEYVALTAMGRIFSVQKVAGLVFYRGLSMQNAVQQDPQGATQYSMCAVNPTRVSKTFSQDDLKWCVAEIARQTGGLLEIVNYNVLHLQYVCAGDVSNSLVFSPFSLPCPSTYTNHSIAPGTGNSHRAYECTGVAFPGYAVQTRYTALHPRISGRIGYSDRASGSPTRKSYYPPQGERAIPQQSSPFRCPVFPTVLESQFGGVFHPA